MDDLDKYLAEQAGYTFDIVENNCVIFALRYHQIAHYIPKEAPAEYVDELDRGLTGLGWTGSKENTGVRGAVTAFKVGRKTVVGLRMDDKWVVAQAEKGIAYFDSPQIVMEWRKD